MVLDYPDWSRVASGALRLIDTITVNGTGSGNKLIALEPSERSIILMCSAVPGVNTASAVVAGNTSLFNWGPIALGTGSAIPFGPVVIPTMPTLDTQYGITYSVTTGVAVTTLYIYGSTEMAPPFTAEGGAPVTLFHGATELIRQQLMASSLPVAIASDQSSLPVTINPATAPGRAGQQTMANSSPVVVASDQSSLPVTVNPATAAGKTGQQLAAASLPVVIASNQPAGTAGQQLAAASVPVVAASDSSPLGPSQRHPYDRMLTHLPIANTQATVTFPATVGFRWVLDHAIWVLTNSAAVAGGVVGQVLDGVTVLIQVRLNIPATSGAESERSIGPMAGYCSSIGASLTVNFSGAGGASVVENVAAGAYLSAI